MMIFMLFSSQFPLISYEAVCLRELRSLKISNDLPDSQSIDCAGCSIHKIHIT